MKAEVCILAAISAAAAGRECLCLPEAHVAPDCTQDQYILGSTSAADEACLSAAQYACMTCRTCVQGRPHAFAKRHSVTALASVRFIQDSNVGCLPEAATSCRAYLAMPEASMAYTLRAPACITHTT